MAEFQARPQEARLYRRHGDAQNLRGLFRGKALHVAQEKSDAENRIEFANHAVENFVELDLGEFFLGEVLKQFLDKNESEMLASAWKGERYAVFEDSNTKQTRLLFLLALDNEEDAARFCGQYSGLLEMKYKPRRELLRRPNFFQFQTNDGGVYLHCFAAKCLVVENATRAAFDKINKAIGMPAAPLPSSFVSRMRTLFGRSNI